MDSMQKAIRLVFLVVCCSAVTFAQPARVRISAWYWLNSAPKADWQGDFVTMHNLGFTDVVLCWGIDLAALRYKARIADTRKAMQLAQRAGLGAYLVIWQPTANSLERRPEYQQVDSAGHRLYSFDVFNAEWRRTDWKQYLQAVAKAYGNEPAMRGYILDDSFTEGPVGGPDGPAGTGIVSYGSYEEKQFGGKLPRSPADPRWNEWVRTREKWWEDWARDTVRFIRDVDPNPQHIIYLEDPAGNALNPEVKGNIGLDLTRVATHFDAVGAYTSASWTSSPGSGARVAQHTRDVLTQLRKVIDPRRLSIYTFWVANPPEERKPGPARYPTVEHIRQICQAALQLGIHDLDMYGYRIGEYRVTRDTLRRLTPGTGPKYPLTGQFPLKFLWDRPQIHDDLAIYLKGLNAK
jgi:hypothetical protein